MTRQVESPFTRFFREKNGFPKFKSKKNSIRSFPIPQHYNLDFENNTVKFPKIGEIKEFFTKHLKGELKTATILKSCTEKYYINILVEYGKEVPLK
jgi:putative transposase